MAFADNLQLELIEPLGGSAISLYQDILPEKDFAIRFHHVCFMIPGPVDAWHEFRQAVDNRGSTVAIEADLGIVQFCYLDTREDLGHYCEYLWASEDIMSDVPRN